MTDVQPLPEQDPDHDPANHPLPDQEDEPGPDEDEPAPTTQPDVTDGLEHT